MHHLAFDIGGKRTGLAAGDDEVGLVSPVGVIEVPRAREEAYLDALVRAVEEHQPHSIVLGLPLNMDGTEGEPAREVRRLGARLAERVGRPVHFQDERLSSYAADQRMARSGRTHRQKKQLRDALAAAEILRDFLAARGRDR